MPRNNHVASSETPVFYEAGGGVQGLLGSALNWMILDVWQVSSQSHFKGYWNNWSTNILQSWQKENPR